MPKYKIIKVEASGQSDGEIETSRRVRVVELDDIKIKVDPQRRIILVENPNVEDVEIIEIGQVPDHREIHRTRFEQVLGINPKVVIDITE